MERIAASAKTRKSIDTMLAQGDFDLSVMLKKAVRLIVEQALEAEATTALGGRSYNAHGHAHSAGERTAEEQIERANPQRNGYRTGALATAEGRIEYAVPQLRGVAGWTSEIRANLHGKSEALERLAVEMYARGLSMRDIEAAFTDETGVSVLTRSVASKIADCLWDDYQRFCTRTLSELSILYLFVDGVHERVHPGQKRDAVMCAWGIDRAGVKHLLGLLPGTKEDTGQCRDFLRDLKARGLIDPVLGTTDGAPGLMRAFEEVFPKSLRQRCLAHKLRNIEAKTPAERVREVVPEARAVYQSSSVALAKMAREAFVKKWQTELPGMVRCFEDDFDACIAHLQLPISHRMATRTTNMLERLFLEERRRTKIIPNAFGEKAMMKLMYAAMSRAIQSWQRLAINEFELKQVDELRKEITDKFNQPMQPISHTNTTHPSKNKITAV